MIVSSSSIESVLRLVQRSAFLAVVLVEEMEEDDLSMILNSMASKRSLDVFPPDDIAWADSCLIGGLDIANTDWSSMKNTLLEILGSEPNLFVSSAAPSNGILNETDIEILPSAEEPESPHSSDASDGEYERIDQVEIKQLLEKFGNLPIKKKSSVFKSGTSAIRSHVDYMKESGDSYLELEFKFSEVNLEDSPRDIFKVWELDFSNQKQELVMQLDKAVGEDSFKPLMIESGAISEASFEPVIMDFDNEMLDDLVAGVADISLDKGSP
ncbi:hypothetical protein RJ641_019508 [Dillenia turbinata]|uniref:Uncharacterized protein n=1 Tax=Dillenia turbinata TaxID=194707 RepID=A0AAN8UWA2_9MAGN